MHHQFSKRQFWSSLFISFLVLSPPLIAARDSRLHDTRCLTTIEQMGVVQFAKPLTPAQISYLTRIASFLRSRMEFEINWVEMLKNPADSRQAISRIEFSGFPHGDGKNFGQLLINFSASSFEFASLMQIEDRFSLVISRVAFDGVKPVSDLVLPKNESVLSTGNAISSPKPN